MKLSELKTGSSAVVERVTDDQLLLKLYELGCLPGTKISVDQKAPFGDPIAIRFSGCKVSLRKSDARKVEVNSVES